MIKGGIPELLNFKQKGKNMDEFIKVPVSEKLAYCFGDPALTLMYTMTTTLLIYFYTNFDLFLHKCSRNFRRGSRNDYVIISCI